LTIEDLPPIRDIINQYGLAAKKSLGQNFICDLNITRKIAKIAGDLTDYTIIEIGPGPGSLTRALLLENAKRVIAIEKDKRCLAALKSLEEAAKGRLVLLEADAMDVKLQEIAPHPFKIVANLPYNLSTQLLMHWLDEHEGVVSLTLMFQKEVANRLVAQPGSKDYGRLSVLTQFCGDAQIKLVLPPDIFTPSPSVYSALVQINLYAPPRHLCNWDVLKIITRAAFAQRRKMLRSTLKPIFHSVEDVLAPLGINPTLRAENLSIEQFCMLADAYEKKAYA
jgi:16S rRNA (adenine1518-N6/adenine1519-N6)-dimethyltransferase